LVKRFSGQIQRTSGESEDLEISIAWTLQKTFVIAMRMHIN